MVGEMSLLQDLPFCKIFFAIRSYQMEILGVFGEGTAWTKYEKILHKISG